MRTSEINQRTTITGQCPGGGRVSVAHGAHTAEVDHVRVLESWAYKAGLKGGTVPGPGREGKRGGEEGKGEEGSGDQDLQVLWQIATTAIGSK